MKAPRGWIKPAGRGSAYCTPGGDYWIVRNGSSWVLTRMARPADSVERAVLGRFPTLTAAVEAWPRLAAEPRV